MTNQEPDQLKTPTSFQINTPRSRVRPPLERRATELPNPVREVSGRSSQPYSPPEDKFVGNGPAKSTPPQESRPKGGKKINPRQKQRKAVGFSSRFSNLFSNLFHNRSSNSLGVAPRQKQRNSAAKTAQANGQQGKTIPKAPADWGRRQPSTPPPLTPKTIPVAKSTKRLPIKKGGTGSTVVYGLRLLILGVGLGAIAGTVLYISDPATRPVSTVKMGATAAKTPSPSSSVVSSPLMTLKLQQEIPVLQGQLEELIKTRPNFQAGVFLQDLDDGSFVNLLGDNSFAAASTIKLPILIAFFQDVDTKKVSLGDILTLEKRFLATGSGELQDQPLGTKYTSLEVATRMMVTSDNTATNMLIDHLGGLEVLNQRFQGWGLKNTSLQAVLPDLEGTNLTTPKELAMALAAVEQGELVSKRSRDLVFSIMQRTKNDSLLPQGLEKNAAIAHKTGSLGALIADAGLIDMPNGKRYLLVVMVKRPRNDQRGEELVRQISRTVYNYFKQLPASGKP